MHNLSALELISRSALESQYDLIIKEGTNKGKFEFLAAIKGVKKPVEVDIHFQIIAEDFILLTGHEVVSHYKQIGERRQWLIDDVLQSAFYGDKSLYAPVEHENGWAIGRHRIFDEVGREPAAIGLFLKKINSVSLELLAVETVFLPSNNKQYQEFHYYFEPQNNWLLTQTPDNQFDETWKENAFETAFDYALSFKTDSEYRVVDEKGQFYFVNAVPDPNNIKLFVLDFSSKFNGFQGRINKYDKYFTYSEISDLANSRSEEGVLWPKPDQLPFVANQFTIHSRRVIGDEVTFYPVGQWVENSNGIGRIASKPEGPYYSICLEGAMKPSKEKFLYSELTPIESPYKEWADPELVMFKFFSHYAYGFGEILAETTHYYKIRPISKINERIADEYLDSIFLRKGEIYGRDFLVATESPEFFELHGTELDFIYIPKREVGRMGEQQMKQVKSFLSEVQVTETEKIINAFLKMANINAQSRDYFVYHLLQLTEDDKPLSTVLDECVDIFVNNRSYGSYEGIYTWFKNKNIETYVFETSY